MSRSDLAGFRKPLDDGKRGEVRTAIIRYNEGYVTCSCGWLNRHIRFKVQDRAAVRHVEDKHAGKAAWL